MFRPRLPQEKPAYPSYRGGRIRLRFGYIHEEVYCPHCVTFRFVQQHRLKMEDSLGRKLQQNEIVHHLNGVRDDNRLTNLALVRAGYHSHRTFVETLQKRIRELEGELASHQLL